MEENDNDLLYVCPTTLDCALTNTCLPCLYKLFPDGTLPSQEVLELPPNQRPENCPRSQPHTVYSGLYTASHRMLTVGDGDFSFSLSLANGIQSMSSSSGSSRGSSNRCQLTATSHESLAQLHITYESVGIVDKLAQLQAHGVTVLHGVDATQLSATTALHQQQYDVIIWNFPCVRAPKGADGQATEIDINKQLLRDFFRNAHDYLTPRGERYPLRSHRITIYNTPIISVWTTPNIWSTLPRPTHFTLTYPTLPYPSNLIYPDPPSDLL